MDNVRKICVVTGTRAEYGLLHRLIKGLNEASDIALQIVALGMHNSPEFGLTYKQIEEDGLYIDAKLETLMSSDTAVGIGKSMGLVMLSFAETLARLKPDILVVLGDRYEIFAAASAAMVARIPIAHLHGGEATEGLIDEAIRHSITKMSHLHFTSTEAYRQRVIQLGEDPSRVFNVGAPGVENIRKTQLMSLTELQESLGCVFTKKTLLVTVHPVTLEEDGANQLLDALFDALNTFDDLTLIFTKSNADADGRQINRRIDSYVASRQNAHVYTSLGRIRYLSAMQFVVGVIGNSSSGILEAPTFKIGTLNIGDRQKGRIKSESVIDCPPEAEAIRTALTRLLSPEFSKTLVNCISPYEGSNTSERIINTLRSFPLEQLLKKRFYDIEVTT